MRAGFFNPTLISYSITASIGIFLYAIRENPFFMTRKACIFAAENWNSVHSSEFIVQS